jgi:pimeloyl-ACP methyl ester carboxylesterase
MVVANVRGIHIYYEVVGQSGPWIAFMPGGRKPGHAILSLAEKIASAGYRVLLHDRRNCGASDVAIEGDQPEYEIWADDLYELLKQLNAFPAIIGGSSSGARTALVLALKYPEHIRALLLMRVTGGSFACTLLAEDYYGQFIRIAEQSGMAGICDTDHFAGCIAARPVNRERLMSMDAAHFIAVMQNWSRFLINGVDQPVLGADEDQLRSFHIPTFIVPGNDKTHPRHVGEKLHQLLPCSDVSIVIDEQFDVDSVPSEEWVAQYDTLTERFTNFIARKGNS